MMYDIHNKNATFDKLITFYLAFSFYQMKYQPL